MARERTTFNILWTALARSLTGGILSSFYELPDEGRGRLEIIAADVFRLDDGLIGDFAETLSYKDFFSLGSRLEYPGGDRDRITRRFVEFLRDDKNLDDRYLFKRVLQFVVEGDDAVSRVLRLAGDIRKREGATLFGKYGVFELAEDGRITNVDFPIYVPSSVEQAERQIEIFWEKYKHLGGPHDRVLRRCSQRGRSVVLIKPHAFHTYDYDFRFGSIIDAFSRAGGSIIGAKVLVFTREQLDMFYKPHVRKKWYEPELVPEMTGGRTLALLYEGSNIQEKLREALTKVVRPAFADSYDPTKTAAHASDPKERGCVEREMRAVNFGENYLP